MRGTWLGMLWTARGVEGYLYKYVRGYVGKKRRATD